MTTTTEVSRRDAIALIAGATTGLLDAGSETHAEEKKVPPAEFDYDVVVVGGGTSGQNAALVLGRACPDGAGLRRGQAPEPHVACRPRLLLAGRDPPGGPAHGRGPRPTH